MKQIKIYKQHRTGKKFIINRQVEDLRLTTHEEYDKMGELQTNRYVEFTTIGQNRTWPDFMAYADFKKLNPNIKV